MGKDSTHQKFADALDKLVAQLTEDRSILAVILCGSLAYDKVWAKSDIDLALVSIDDKKVEKKSIALNADGVNVHAFLVPRAEFRKLAEGSLRNSFMHSLLAKGRLLYTQDETIAEIFAALEEIGERDTQVQLLHAGMHALSCIHKAHKWLVTRGDLDYTALWILYAATPLAKIEVVGKRMLVDREVLPQAMKLNPDFFETIYSEMLNTKKTTKNVAAALAAIDQYVRQRAEELFGPVLEHLREVGEARSCTEIDDHFKRNFGIESITPACEYLSDEGLLGKASTSVQLTKKSNVLVQELAFYARTEIPDSF